MGTVNQVTKRHGRKQEHDKFYTNPKIAKECLNLLDLNSYDTIIEPSAGNGAFSSQINNVVALDINPEDDTILKQDWFTFVHTRDDDKKVLVVGNPPFGIQNNLAVNFINHAALFADTVAFILPLSFKKESVQKRLNRNLHLTSETLLPKNSFLLKNEPYHVPSIFQIWGYNKTVLRPVIPSPMLVGFTWCTQNDNPDIWVQRIGGNTGKVGVMTGVKSNQSNFFLKVSNGFTVEQVITELNRLNYSSRFHSVGPKSVSKKEILLELQTLKSSLVI